MSAITISKNHQSNRVPLVQFLEEHFVVRTNLLEQWKRVFSAIDVQAEIDLAHTWARAHPAKRHWQRFLVNWLKKAQREARAGRGAPAIPLADRAKQIADNVAQWEEAKK